MAIAAVASSSSPVSSRGDPAPKLLRYWLPRCRAVGWRPAVALGCGDSDQLEDRIRHPQRRADYPPRTHPSGAVKPLTLTGAVEGRLALGGRRSSSPKPSRTRARMRSTPARRRAPSASIRSTSPAGYPVTSRAVGLRAETGAARSVAMVTRASSKASASTMSAAGRACMPSGLTMVAS